MMASRQQHPRTKSTEFAEKRKQRNRDSQKSFREREKKKRDMAILVIRAARELIDRVDKEQQNQGDIACQISIAEKLGLVNRVIAWVNQSNFDDVEDSDGSNSSYKLQLGQPLQLDESLLLDDTLRLNHYQLDQVLHHQGPLLSKAPSHPDRSMQSNESLRLAAPFEFDAPAHSHNHSVSDTAGSSPFLSINQHTSTFLEGRTDFEMDQNPPTQDIAISPSVFPFRPQQLFKCVHPRCPSNLEFASNPQPTGTFETNTTIAWDEDYHPHPNPLIEREKSTDCLGISNSAVSTV